MVQQALLTAKPGDLTPPDVLLKYTEMLAEDGHHHPEAFFHASARFFGDVDLRGKRVLEIGSGRGLAAIYASLQGAADVVSLEPELVGASSGVIATQRDRIAALGLTNVTLLAQDFNTWNPGSAKFDVIVSRASINHLYESDRHALRDPETYRQYSAIARKIHDLLDPGGVFIASDACRHAFFTMARRFGVRRPWHWKRSGVNWRHHQNPGTWRRIFLDAGFQKFAVAYPVPYRLRHFAIAIDNVVANFFLKGAFIVRATR